jgi:mono/diheme cytochrome c family protein
MTAPVAPGPVRRARSVPLALPALAALVALTGCEVFDPMWTQQKVKPYRESEFYPDRISMRAAPAGTVARAQALSPGLVTGRGPDGKPLERSPVEPTRPLLELGRRKFEVNCAVCHGFLGDGESLVARNMSIRPPASLHQRAGATDGWYFQVITEGFGVMPSYASALTVDERWAVVAYVRALQLSQRARLDLLAPEDRARLEREPR